MDRKGEYYNSPSKNAFRRKTLLFQKSSGIEKKGQEGGGTSRFSVDYLCLRVLKRFLLEPFFASEIFGIEKNVLIKERGEGGIISTFRRKFVVSHYRKT